jgi:DNA-binding HxlR family transcriptional regulator
MRKILANPKGCGVIRSVSYIGGKWKLLILLALLDGQVRFGKLLFMLSGISKKMLTQELKELEEDGLVIRESFMEKPPRVEYRLSEQGKTVIPVLNALQCFGSGLPDPANRSSTAHCYQEELSR